MSEPITDSLEWRYAVKCFDRDRRIPDADWQQLEDALVLSPSAYGLQPWRFLLVQDPATRRRLTEASSGQNQVETCSHFLVLCARRTVDAAYIDEYVAELARVRNLAADPAEAFRRMVRGDLLGGPKSRDVAEWAARQVYLALGVLITAAAHLRIDACPMEGIHPTEYDTILNLASSDYRTVVACALGYRSGADGYSRLPKVRFGKAKLFRRYG